MSFLARFRRSASAPPPRSGAPPEEARLPGEVDPAMEMEASTFLATRSPEAPVLDVRTPGEFSQGHLRGARNVDVMGADFPERVESLGLDPQGPVYLYCRSGNRSGKAARILRDRGYARAFNVGGLEELAREGGEVV